MHIYSTHDLYNKRVQEQALEALDQECIGKDSFKNIFRNHVTRLYTPNYFIRAALLLLTVVAVTFGSMLLSLVFKVSGSMVAVPVLFAGLTYAVLEWIVRKKQYYNAGVDNVLMFFSVLFFLNAVIVSNYSDRSLVVSIVGLLSCLWIAVRFTDSFMAMLSYVAFLASVFLSYVKLGQVAKETAPFVMMIVSAGSYIGMKKLMGNDRLLFYHSCFKWVKVLTMVSFYASGNYYVVKELNSAMFDLKPGLNDTIPFGWLFWLFTMAVPLVYVLNGIGKKDLIFIRTGLFLTAVSIATFRYYYSFIPAEIAMLAVGGLLSVISLVLMNYLKTPKRGFVFDGAQPKHKKTSALESLVLVAAPGNKDPTEANTDFGGGSFGGGGAGDRY